jgi:hypothetical protein
VAGVVLRSQEVLPKTPHMATDDITLKLANQELAEALANIQRAVDQIQQQQALQIQALLNATRGQWDAARYGTQSVEAILVALNPALQGKVHAVPFGEAK